MLSTWRADIRVVITIRNFVDRVGQLHIFEERQNNMTDSRISPIRETLESNLAYLLSGASIYDNFYYDCLLAYNTAS